MIRVPPHSQDLERHIIGAALLDGETADVALDLLNHGDFYDNRHSELFQAIARVRAKHLQPDGLTVAEDLRSVGKLSQAGGEEYLVSILGEVVSGASITSHAKIVKAHSMRRRAIGVLNRAMETAWDHAIAPETAIEAVQGEILGLGDREGGNNDLQPMARILQDSLPEWHAAASGKIVGVTSGLARYDALICGFRPGTLNVFGGRPAMGKSMLTLQMARRSQDTVASYSLEMKNIEQAERLISMEVPGLPTNGMRNAMVLKQRNTEIQQAMKDLSQSKIWMNDSSGANTSRILLQCRRLKKKHGLSMVVVDYLQLMTVAGKSENRTQEVDKISKGLKFIAGELDVPVMAIASLSRSCESREDKRPIQSDLRECGGIESDAHTITMIYRHSKYDKRFKDDRRLEFITEIIVRKNRTGNEGTCLTMFDGARSRFYDVDPMDLDYYINAIKEPNKKDNTNGHAF